MAVKALVVGGTGLVSTGIVQQLLVRGFQVSVFNRGLRPSSVRDRVRLIRGDRAEASGFVQAFEREQFDVVYDMICYKAEDAETSARAFAGRCEQFVLCSSAVVYGRKMPSSVLIDERAPLEPTSHWGKSKVACEQTLVRAAEKGAFKLTIARLGHTYGPGDSMNDQQDSDSLGWDRTDSACGSPLTAMTLRSFLRSRRWLEPIVQKRERQIVDGAVDYCRKRRTRLAIPPFSDRAWRDRDPAVWRVRFHPGGHLGTRIDLLCDLLCTRRDLHRSPPVTPRSDFHGQAPFLLAH